MLAYLQFGRNQYHQFILQLQTSAFNDSPALVHCRRIVYQFRFQNFLLRIFSFLERKFVLFWDTQDHRGRLVN